MECPTSSGRGDRSGEQLPGVFNAAGLIVPEPSIMSLPMPFIDVEAGWGAVYITPGGSTSRWPAESLSSHRPRWRATAPVAGCRPSTAILPWRESRGWKRSATAHAILHARPGANEVHELRPLFPRSLPRYRTFERRSEEPTSRPRLVVRSKTKYGSCDVGTWGAARSGSRLLRIFGGSPPNGWHGFSRFGTAKGCLRGGS